MSEIQADGFAGLMMVVVVSAVAICVKWIWSDHVDRWWDMREREAARRRWAQIEKDWRVKR